MITIKPTMEHAYQEISQNLFSVNDITIIMWGFLISFIILSILIKGDMKRLLHAIIGILIAFISISYVQEYQTNQETHTFKFKMAYYKSLHNVVKQLSNAQKQHYNLAVVKKRIKYRLNPEQMQRLNDDSKIQKNIANNAFEDWNKLDTIKSNVQSNVFNDNATYLNVPIQLNHVYPIYWNVQDMNLFGALLNRKYLYNDGLRQNIDNLNSFKYKHYNDYQLQQKLIKKYTKS